MEFGIGCCCGVTCFGCRGKKSDQIIGVQCDVGSIAGIDPQSSTGGLSYISYSEPFGRPTTINGTMSWEKQASSVTSFAGEISLQAKPDTDIKLACKSGWRKRNITRLDSIYHYGASKYVWDVVNGGFDYAGNIEAAHYTTKTNNYVNPNNVNDQWSEPYTWPAVLDSRCGQPVSNDPYYAQTKFKCARAFAYSTVTLSIGTLEDGNNHWHLSVLVSRYIATWSNFYLTNSEGTFYHDESVNTYGDYLRLPFPYQPGWTAELAWVQANTPVYNLIGTVCLRWTKPVECNMDFRGDPIVLTLDSPFTSTADSLGVTGYSHTAVVNLTYA